MSTLPLEFRDVTCTFGPEANRVHALRNVSFSLNPGELVAVMGPSGSGKSTLLNIAGLLLQPSSGEVLIDGVETSQMSQKKAAELRRDHLGVVFQRYNLMSTFTVGENVALPLELGGQKLKEMRGEIQRALAEVGLEDIIDRFPEEISGGQAQRVAIARALIGSRGIILADEPTGALDTATSDDVMRILRGRIDAGAAGILVTHEARFAGWADRVIYLRDGQIAD
ncbi:ABC transporter ATP-binding protein [Corynebacterium sp. 153RC1]|uniref:ABC transporter ATP-binding protein n=1 Tax=unclassified Corynebacterium TaxID=2624378 RepID=UPI00211C745C|nr:ABC transporter ATP-binding protein [Corynebacterium sp. 209RC1]MCQ9355583.1 ABC transporter ATP-binding protein [Corynebacterium sp. 1222RC1]MCQ9357767.1 ABC transporter ATP-binding protein [Corynebacterium sp. 122RC1]MCQ9359972.1 ABC transporter ATP-binding protein [Corynebacterium sp. 142RC1]MCQ9362104.1 ABC transporter ATP-binding protein [Corynebacterium sp. 153RC1]MCQ9364233.1 ABC transporter ATP-binding protein [Corynebacterium sp. 732RC1]MCQ9366382.1 ABC transporter ATP-binding pro